eukprot:g46412.t1
MYLEALRDEMVKTGAEEGHMAVVAGSFHGVVEGLKRGGARDCRTASVVQLFKNDGRDMRDLQTNKQVDLSTVDLKKLRVKELRKILDEWGES